LLTSHRLKVMNIAAQTQSLLHGLLAEKNPTKWLEILNSPHLPKVAIVVMILLIASQSADLTWRLVPQSESGVPAPQRYARESRVPAKTTEGDAGLEAVVNLHLFGKAGAVKKVKIEAKAPETRLNLTLHGVYVDEDPELGAAIIGESGSTQKYYKAGAQVMSGVTLQGVFSDRVVLLRNGQSEVLRFPKVPSAGTLASSSRRPTSRLTRPPAAMNRTTSLSGYREVFQNEPLKIFEHVRFVPVRSREGLKGYRVLPQKNRELYNKLGIRPSDLVTAVNGVTLTNDREAMKLIDMLKDASTLQVDVLRNGQPQSLTFDLN
jgi:general secretion pathway protein C